MKTKTGSRDPVGAGIRGWELSNPDPDLFETRVVKVFGNCAECEILHQCTTPCESIRELVPRRGELIELGMEEYGDEERTVYYILKLETERRFVVLFEHKYFWSRLQFVPEEELPESIQPALQVRMVA